MKTITLHTRIDVAKEEITITIGDKVTASIKELDGRMLDIISMRQRVFLEELTAEVERLGYQVTLRTAPLFPVPDRPSK